MARPTRFAHARAPLALAFVASVHAVALTAAGPLLAQSRAPAPASAPQAAPARAAGPDLIARGLQLFDDQEYEESVQALSAALLRPNNTKAQKLEIYRLLALNYITLNRKDEAESAVRGLLSQEPGYELPRSESPRFRDFFAAVRERWEAEGRPGVVEGEVVPVTMQHTSPSEGVARTQIPLTVRVVDPKHRVVDVKLFYRAGAKGKFTQIAATIEGDSARATIPGDAVKPPLVEYYFEGLDKGGLPVVSRGDAAGPLRVAVPEGSSKGWVLPVAVGGSALGIGATFLVLALAGAFKGSTPSTPGTTVPEGRSIVSVSVRE